MADLWYMYMYLAAAKLAVFRRNFYFGGFVISKNNVNNCNNNY